MPPSECEVTAVAKELHVSIATEQLRATARDIAVKVSGLKAVFEDMDMAVKRTEGYWIGEAAEAHREAYRRMSPEREAILAYLFGQADDLAAIAGIWEEKEEEVKELAQSLPGDVIV